jgi:transcriptional regulator with XRE-family HTH domain
MNLHDLRKEHSLTLKEVAFGTNLHLASVSNYENGWREPNVKVMRAFANFYGLNIEKIFECVEHSIAGKKLVKSGAEYDK